ncbi:GntR family transcriptional regulator [Desertihabitans brevis]|uniref:GntR family transcriptional regulator n=1 Tax=Desertihabitans brevis TaxID=2268447 RepID=A0A367YVA2_9ACTN|nr:GntR family transcriptional regulator [Desertihabitans brevis]RCK68952.1 GntR family transcriptional regulator [Desertihabitans brevis]
MTSRDRGRGEERRRGLPIADEVYNEILSSVLFSRVQAGDRITIDAVAREYNVSQTPVREALHRLQADGIVVRHHLAGYRVAPMLTREQFEDLVELRLLLEPAAARRAAERMSVEELGELRALSAEMSTEAHRSTGEHAYARFSQLDAQFHEAVARGGGNQFVRESLTRLHTHVHLFRLAHQTSITSEAIDEHEAVIEAIASRAPDAAAFAMRQHLEASARRFRAAFDT